MSTLTGDIESSSREDPIPSPIIVASSSFADEKGSAIKNVFMGCSRSELTGEFESLQMASTPIQNKSCDQTPVTKPQGPAIVWLGFERRRRNPLHCRKQMTIA